ncbi:MAG: BatD family protein [Marinifilaceae bacterium]
MRWLSLLFACLFSINAFADEVVFRASAPNVVEVGERFRLTYTLNRSGQDIQLPQIPGFSVMGPSTSQSSSVEIINGKMSKSVSNTFTYVLVAQEEGNFTLPAATVRADGKMYKSNALSIQVIKGNGSQQQGQASGGGQQQESQAAAPTSNTINNENLFLKVDVSKNQLYLGESLVATIKVYSKVDLTNLGRSKFPAFEGFLSEELPTGERIELVREEYNGQIYNVGIIRKLLLYPQHAGKLTIEPFELECMVRQRVAGGGGSIFDDFFGNYREVRVMRTSKPVTINVKELPQSGRPVGFSGIVGALSMNSSISTDTLAANDALTYTLTFKGIGNLKLLSAPKLNLPADFEVYEPKINQQIQTGTGGMNGTVTVEYLVIPRFAGEYTIPAVTFSYFDTRDNQYRTLSGKPYTIRVAKGTGVANTGTTNTIQSFKKEDIKTMGEDIRYIKTGDLKLHARGPQFYRHPAYWWALLLPAFLFALGIILNRRRIKANADIAGTKNKKANKMAIKRMKLAGKAMKENNADLFYDEVLKALWGYVGYKLNIDTANLNRDNISELLSQRGADTENIQSFIDVLDRTEFARYAPGGNKQEEMHRIYEDGISVITKLEKVIK